jgi:K(+)-stimulated pyrophosphate-energized sodium pump
LDAVGNVTKAMTKGFAIAAATFTAIATNMLFVNEVMIIKKIKIVCDITNPLIFVGLLIGGTITFIFCGLAMRAVGEAAKSIVMNVREQFLHNPEILNGNAKPDYMASISYLTNVSIKKMILPALLPIVIPIGSFFLYKFFLGEENIFDFLMAIGIGNTIMGIYTSISMTTTGGAWDNCKKYIEEGHFGGKGSETHKCAVTGDTVGDPLKDTAGPALNVLIKILGIVLSLFILIYK